MEEECLQTLAEDRKWRGRLDIHRQCVSEYGRSDGKRTTTDSWQTEWWNVQLMRRRRTETTTAGQVS